MTSVKPSLDLLRSLTDEHVLRSLMARERLTRAEIAASTGISKPTISDSVRRLTESGLLVDTGERTTGRGRAGSYYSLAETAGTGLVAVIAPTGVTTEAVDALGRVLARAEAALGRSPGPDLAAETLASTAEAVRARLPAPLRCAVVSAADPVDRTTGRLVQLPDSPFLIGDLDPAAVLAGIVDGPVLVDNDVNWAARAERDAGVGVDDFVYLHLGEGLGCAVVTEGAVRRGHHGLAGEIAHLHTAGPGGRSMPLTDVFATLDLRRPGSAAIDAEALLSADTGVRDTVARAVCGVLSAAIALTDPELVVVGGGWGPDTRMLRSIRDGFAREPRNVPVVPARVPAPELTATRTHAVSELRDLVIAATRPPST